MSLVRNAYHDNVRWDIFPYLPKSPGRVLDVGGGIGATAAAIKKESNCKEVGVIDLVAANAQDTGIDFSYSASLEDPEILNTILSERGTFDTILCLDILEHLKDPWKVVQNLENLLDAGGVIIASIPNVQHISVVGPLLKGYWRLADDGILDRTHLRFFTKQTAVELMTNGSMKLEVVDSLLTKKSRSGRLNAITAGVFENFLTTQFVVKVRKP
jgi:2-polyprenyl-3-methyl-5-hydroxy-6-metoxy-1,4-benzoquinol methylase